MVVWDVEDVVGWVVDDESTTFVTGLAFGVVG